MWNIEGKYLVVAVFVLAALWWVWGAQLGSPAGLVSAVTSPFSSHAAPPSKRVDRLIARIERRQADNLAAAASGRDPRS